MPRAVAFGSFNRVPGGPRAQRHAEWIPKARGVAHAVKRMCHSLECGIEGRTRRPTVRVGLLWFWTPCGLLI